MHLLFDSHAHLTLDPLLSQLDSALERAKEKGVGHIINICTDEDSLRHGIPLAAQYPWIKNAAAVTPHDAAAFGDAFFSVCADAAKNNQLCAIGETGLDYHYLHSPKEVQKAFLQKHFALARATHLPIVFHCRDAFADLFALADAEYQGPAILHCFTGSAAEADGVLQRGWFLSFSGIVTFKKSIALREVVKQTPLSQLLIETDAPFLAPEGHRGKMNEPAFIAEIARCIALIKNIPVDTVIKSTEENGLRIFGLSKNSILC